MLIKKTSLRLVVSENENILFNIGQTINIFDISNNNVSDLMKINTLRNPSDLDISTDGSRIANSNTSGHIAVHDISSGELIIKSKCLSKEGDNIYFNNNDKEIIGSTWSGKVFIFDITSGKVDTIYKSDNGIDNIYKMNNESEYILLEDFYDKGSRISLLRNPMPSEVCIPSEVSTPYSLYFIEPRAYSKVHDAYYFLGSLPIKRVKRSVYDPVIFKITNKDDFSMEMYCNIKDMAGINKIKKLLHYVKCMCVSKNERYLLLGCSDYFTEYDIILGFDLCCNKLIGIKQTEYISSLHFISSDTKVVIGTWTHIEILDFSSLFEC